MHSKPVKRKPVKRFVSWKFSERRLARVKKLGIKGPRTSTFKLELKSMFDSAENFFGLGLPRNVSFLFVGQGMRPLFETIRGINEFKQLFRRRALKYIVSPAAGNQKKSVEEIIREELLRRKVVPKGKRIFYVVDVVDSRKTLRTISAAIKSINPDVQIEFIDPFKSQIGLGLAISEMMPRPLLKGPRGLMEKTNLEIRDTYLWFQKSLQEYLCKYRKK